MEQKSHLLETCGKAYSYQVCQTYPEITDCQVKNFQIKSSLGGKMGT